jgi:hypothetical protein
MTEVTRRPAFVVAVVTSATIAAAALLASGARDARAQDIEAEPEAASAPTITVRCDTWASPQRSRASVDGAGLASGSYQATLLSGSHSASSPMSAESGGDVQFDFDSNKKEIQNGATKISPNFIVHEKVTAHLLDSTGTIILTKTKKCKSH